MQKKDTTNMHYNNARFNILDHAPMAVYHPALAGHWLVMGFKIDNSPIDVQLSKMEVAIENIVFLAAVGNLAVKELMEREVIMAITAKVTFMEEPKCTMAMAKNVRQVVSRVVETLVDMPK